MGGYTIKKGTLDVQVAKELGLKPTEVSAITAVFLEKVRNELVELNTVELTGFGFFRMSVRGGGTDNLLPVGKNALPVTVTSQKKYHVSFRKSGPFTRALRERYRDSVVEKTMSFEKYGVDEAGAENEKKASQGCPVCGAKVERHGNILACPKCGTEPFEQKAKTE